MSAKTNGKLPKPVEDALKDDEPIRRLRELRDRLEKEMAGVGEDRYLIPQLSSQIQACIRLIETLKEQILVRHLPRSTPKEGSTDGDDSGPSDNRTASERWAERVDAAHAGSVS